MSSESVITEDDVARLRRVLDKNRQKSLDVRGAEPGLRERRERQARDHSAWPTVRAEIERRTHEGKRVVSVREIYRAVDVSPTLTGRIMSLLADDGVLEQVSSHNPRKYRVVDVADE